MRIVDRATFLAAPEGTVFQKYRPCVGGPLSIKYANTGRDDFWYSDLDLPVMAEDGNQRIDRLEDAELNGASIEIDLEVVSRDGLFDAEQLFAIYEPRDVQAIIDRLERALYTSTNPAG